jgi:16S rRNA G966 N2-methylase RsmD
VIRENLRLTGFEGRATVYPIAAERAAGRLEGAYTLVLADPPYEDAGAAGVLREVAASPLVTEETTFVVEHSAREEAAGRLAGFELRRTLRHGDSAASIYCSTGGEHC